jgi:Ca2+/Na+ antiporter
LQVYFFTTRERDAFEAHHTPYSKMIKLTMKKKQHKADVESKGRDSMVTSMGTLRGRYHVRALCQTVAFVCLVGGYCLVNLYNMNNASMMESSEIGIDLGQGQDHRRLEEEIEDACDDLNKADPGWLCAFYGIGVLYMFLALAVVCDEFFVPALEEMSCPRRLNLSMDVAGATLMAAGGSAPELFTSLFGTFSESDIGFGTIVGSAVFNVLFVIAMCSLLTKEVLHLTWWPLFRDSSYYATGLVVLCIFTGVVSPGEIELWEAIVLFAMYLGYILIMWQNANIYKKLTGKVLEYPEDNDDDDDDDAPKNGDTPLQEAPEAPNGEPRPAIRRTSSKGSVLSNASAKDITAAMGGVPVSFRWQGTFRAGILKLLRDPNSWADTAGVGIVAKICGDADYVFSQVDIDGNGHVDREELKQLFNLLECYVSPAELEEVFNQLDVDKDGTVRNRGCASIEIMYILYLII